MNYSKKGIRDKQKALHATGTKWSRKLLLALTNLTLLGCVALAIIVASAGIGVFKGIIDTSPSIENIDVTPTGFSTFVYDLEGNQIGKLIAADSNRIPVAQDMIPEDLAHAFVAIEDERFYEHNGIDIKGIIRAAYVGISNGFDFSEGASTITQQLLKNNVFTGWTSESSFAESLKRKIQEQYLAIELSKTMSKEEVLLNYMNTINLGQNTLGVQAASLRYFNKSVNTLNLSECAVIASITQNPSRFNPISHPEDNAKRRTKVLNNMLEQGYITQAEYDEAMADDVYSRIQTVNAEVEQDSVNTYFVDALTDDIMEDLMATGRYTETQAYTLLYSGGLKIYATQDPNIQSICDDVFSNEENYPEGTRWQLAYELTIKKANGDYENFSTEMYRTYYRELNPSFNLLYNSKDEAYTAIEEYKAAVMASGDEVYGENITLTPQPQVSIVVQDHSTGYVVAMVGGRGQKEGSRTLNRATDAKRQPGSTFKVVGVYAPALDSAGLTLATVMNDAPFNYNEGRPVSNWWGAEYRGLSSLRQGIIDSMNIVAVKTLTQITPQLGFDYLKNFGFTTLVEREEITVNGQTQIFSDIQQSLALGGITRGVTNEELTASYAAIANGGTYIKPKLYTKVLDHDGNVILDNTQPQSRQVIKETTAWLLTDAMVDVVTSGTGTSVNFGNMAIAGKTGTTSDYNDVWFAGYTPYYTASVWTGYDNNTKLRKDNGERNLAKKLWRATMAQIHEDLPSKSFEMPINGGIVTATVCSKSGKLPIPGVCDGTLTTEYFAEGTVPTATCDVHYQGMICQYSNPQLPACETCPFKVSGVLEMTPMEDPSLQQGTQSAAAMAAPDGATGQPAVSTTVPITQEIVNEDGTVTTITVPQTQTNYCMHTAEYMSQPGIEAIVEQQRSEIAAVIAAAQAAAAQAAEAAAQAPATEG